jgi:WD40 repeat protein
VFPTSPMITRFASDENMSLIRSMTTCHPIPSRLRAILALLVAVSASVAVPPAALADDPRPIRVLGGHRFEVYSVAFSPDAKIIASGGGYLGPDLKPGEIMLWDDGAKGKARPTQKPALNSASMCPSTTKLVTIMASPINGALAKNKHPLKYDRSVLLATFFCHMEAVGPVILLTGAGSTCSLIGYP